MRALSPTGCGGGEGQMAASSETGRKGLAAEKLEGGGELHRPETTMDDMIKPGAERARKTISAIAGRAHTAMPPCGIPAVRLRQRCNAPLGPTEPIDHPRMDGIRASSSRAGRTRAAWLLPTTSAPLARAHQAGLAACRAGNRSI